MDPFGPTLTEERRHGFLFPIPGGVVYDQPTLVRNALLGLNKLAGMKFNNASQLFHRPLTAVQREALVNVQNAVAEAGDCPLLSGREALDSMMKSHPTYGEPSTLVPYDAEKLKILLSTRRSKPIEQLLPPHVAPLMQRCKTHIELSAEEAHARFRDNPKLCPKQPYWDPILKNDRGKRSHLIAGLWKIGVISFRTSIKAPVGLFFVRKKTPEWIRMVVDCRISNAYHRQPPVTRLGSSACFADLEMAPDLLDFRLGSNGSKLSGESVGWGSELDVADCFYQFEMKQLAKWFGINDPRSVEEWEQWGIKLCSVYDEDLGHDVSLTPSTVVYPVIAAMPMGWTWALFFANETVAAIAKGTSIGKQLECRERMPTPQFWESETFTSTYVDNVSVFGAAKQDVCDRMQALTKAFEKHDIPVVWTYDQPVRKVETVGVIVDFDKQVILNKPSRLWKIYLAGRELARRDRVRGEAVEVWLGHITSVFRLCPCLLSIFTVIYRFVAVSRGKRVKLWPAVKAEIMQSTALVWLARAPMGGQYVNQVDMGDSSSTGYALLTRSFPASKIQQVCRFREKWRFVPLPEDFKNAVEFFNRDGAQQSTDAEEHIRAFTRAGVGMDTEYGKWLQSALQEGSWLKTSPIISQFKTPKKRRDDVDVPALIEPLPSDMTREGTYKLLWMKRWRNPNEHINIKEGRVLLSSLKRAARVSSQVRSKKLSLSDNLSAILAFDKGRSASSAMNKLCKTSAAIQTALQIRWKLRHVETKRNLADEPSRGKRVRMAPICELTKYPEICVSPSLPSVVRAPSYKPRYNIVLADLIPPPGLGKCAGDVSVLGSACGSQRATGPVPCGAMDDHGHPTCAKKRSACRQSVRVCWEIFAGDGKLSQALKRKGCHVLFPIDIRVGPQFDLTKKSNQSRVLHYIRKGYIDYIHLGTPCTVFSRARRGIKNFEKARKRELIGCELAFFSAEVAMLCNSLGVGWSIENPQSSRLWEFDAISQLRSLPGVSQVHFPMCAFGENYKKPTMLLTNCNSLSQLSRQCMHTKHAEVLKGRVRNPAKGWVNRTSLAGAYPDKLCDRWAQIIGDDVTLPCHDKKELGSDFEQVAKEPFAASSDSPKSGEVECPITSKIPGLLDCVVFGNHSKAEAARRRQRRAKAKENQKTALQTRRACANSRQ